jgi:F-type H+-transporting ATPase subunit a
VSLLTLLAAEGAEAAETAAPVVGKPFEVPEAGHLFNYHPLVEVKVPDFLDLDGVKDGVLGITWPMLVMALVTVLLITFFVVAFRRFKLVPSGSQNVAEAGLDLIRSQIAQPILGNRGEGYMPLLTAMFFWVFFLNVMGIIPGVQFPITSRMAIPAMLSIMVWVVYNYVGIKNQGPIGYFKSMMFPPGVPKPVYILLAPLELISTVVVRPVTLAVRLYANMVAGHLLLVVLTLATATFMAADSWHKVMAAFPLGFGVIMTGFEIFVAGMQAFIITILTAVYIAGAQEAHH